MLCPKCAVPLNDNANFCQTCGFAMDAIPRVEPIVVRIEPEEPTVVVQPQPAPRVVQEVVREVVVPPARSNTPLYLMLGSLLFLTACALAFFAYVYFNRQTPAVGVNNSNAKTVTVAVTPTPKLDFGDWLDTVAPETKRSALMDEQFELAAGETRAEAFAVPSDVKSARIVGGLKVVAGEAIDFYVLPKEIYDAGFPTAAQKPVKLEKIRNKKINARLAPGEYVIVFQSTPTVNKGLTVATNLVLVFD